MRRMWNEIRGHRLSATLFLLYWVAVFSLDAFGWKKPADRPEDMVQPVISLHLLLSVIAGALIAWWRRSASGRITGGMIAGATVIVIDVAALLTHQFIAFALREPSTSGESAFELPVLLIAVGLLGAILGLIGAAGSTGLGRVLDRWHEPSAADLQLGGVGGAAVQTRFSGAGGMIPRRLLRVAGGLVLGAALVVLLVVIPTLAADGIAWTAPRAIPAFVVNAVLNVLIGIALLAPVSRRSSGAGKVLIVMAGFVSLLLGFALLDAAAALMGHHGSAKLLSALACFAGAAADLGAGVLGLIAVFRHYGNNYGGPLPVS